MSGYTARRGDNAHRDAVLQRPLGPALRRRLPCVPDSRWSAAPDHNDHPIGVLAWSADLLALVLARHLDGQTVDMDLRAGGRYLLFTGGLEPVVDDRPHLNVFIFPLFPPSCRAAGRPGRRPASASRLTPYHWARVLQAGQAGSRLPLRAEDARPQISRDTGRCETPGGASGAAFVPDAPERIGVPSP